MKNGNMNSNIRGYLFFMSMKNGNVSSNIHGYGQMKGTVYPKTSGRDQFHRAGDSTKKAAPA
jgi:hypothetical protein